MKLTDQEMKEAEKLAREYALDSVDTCHFVDFLAGITAALSSDKLLARVREERRIEHNHQMAHYIVGCFKRMDSYEDAAEWIRRTFCKCEEKNEENK